MRGSEPKRKKKQIDEEDETVEKESKLKKTNFWLKVIYISKKQFETCHDLGVVENMFTFERGDLRKSRDF